MILLLIFTFIFGLIIGSFLNALIYRLEIGKGLGGRSFCPHCRAKINWYDLFPVISWVALRGKCRNCHNKISIQYPLVEFATGLIFVMIGYFFIVFDSGPSFAQGFGTGWQARMTHILLLPVIPAQAGIQSASVFLGLIFWLVFAAGLVAIFVYDLKHQIIPNEIIYPLLVSGLIYILVNALFLPRFGTLAGNLPYLYDHLLSGLVAGGFFYALAAVSGGKWMGGGDIKLVAFMGLVLGWQGTVTALYTAFILGAIFGLAALLSRKKAISSRIPFAPFLVIGTFIGFFFGEQMVSFYAKMFL